MFRFLTALLCSLSVAHLLYAQIKPAEGGKLNYRVIGFRFLPEPHAHNYYIEIASGNYNTEDSFKKNIILTVPAENNRTIAEVPAFGAVYTWRYSYMVKKTKMQSPLYHFSTLSVPEVDTNITRFRVIKPAEKYNDHYVFLDGNRALYDMKGNPVWFLPDKNIKWSMEEKYILDDVQCSPFNTITYLSRGIGYEINYDGTPLWTSPKNGKVSGDSDEHCHHQFTRLNNGHYMVLGNEFRWKFPWSTENFQDINLNTVKKINHAISFGTLIEYDEEGNVVWSWKSSKYFLGQDSNFYVPPYKNADTFNDNKNAEFSMITRDVHENAFFFDEKNKVVYVSFKNVSLVIKLKYPEGTVLNTYYGVNATGKNLFCHQHSCRISQNGNLYLFNNNLCANAPAKIGVFQEPVNEKDTLKKIWEYQCTVEGNNPSVFTSGGNVYELPDSSMFISMGSDYSKVLIVSPDKRVLWSAIPEKWDREKKNWHIIHQARSSIMSRQQLENLIWNSE